MATSVQCPPILIDRFPRTDMSLPISCPLENPATAKKKRAAVEPNSSSSESLGDEFHLMPPSSSSKQNMGRMSKASAEVMGARRATKEQQSGDLRRGNDLEVDGRSRDKKQTSDNQKKKKKKETTLDSGEMSFRPSDSSPSGGGRCCDVMGLRPEHNRHWRTSSSILFLVSSLLILAIANAHQQLPTAAGYAERTDEVMEGGRELLAGGTTGRQPGAAAASGETQSSRLPSDMVDVVVGRGRRRGQPKGAAASRERMEGGVEHQPPLLHRRGRQAAPESTEMLSSSRIDHADIGTIMLDAKYPLSGFDDVNFDDSGGGIGPLSGLDESEIGRRLGGGSLLHYQATVTTPATSHSANKGDESESEAAFSGALETNVTASLGQTAFLRCRLKNSKHQRKFGLMGWMDEQVELCIQPLLHWKRCALVDSNRVNSPIESNCFRPLCCTVGVEEESDSTG
ncbi:hypothetical protein DAPPUDRAFT_232857 [Daphnia pulex]|uniref:Uncharacterized protein n=1 Tax=Daphnia pulex TaxID=6669 RepID=E9FSJ4_DAPPU|nr:hypothetical protein DAPPUDRAFT_232857 [Daphnia pulex]|eukprot:EFX89821.1 hypothetical protein DAPPUDRAFT_232857 [Daphnia pulex]